MTPLLKSVVEAAARRKKAEAPPPAAPDPAFVELVATAEAALARVEIDDAGRRGLLAAGAALENLRTWAYRRAQADAAREAERQEQDANDRQRRAWAEQSARSSEKQGAAIVAAVAGLGNVALIRGAVGDMDPLTAIGAAVVVIGVAYAAIRMTHAERPPL